MFARQRLWKIMAIKQKAEGEKRQKGKTRETDGIVAVTISSSQ